jgi:hypothetical protein
MATDMTDSLGNVAQYAGDAAEALKQLVSSLNSVTSQTKSGNNEVVDKLDEQTRQNKAKQDKLEDAIKSLPKEFVDAFKKDMPEIKEWIETIKKFAEAIKTKRETKKDTGNNFMEKVTASMSSVAANIKKVSDRTVSSAGVLEGLVTKFNTLLDNLNKTLRSKSSGSRSSKTKDVQTATPPVPSDRSGTGSDRNAGDAPSHVALSVPPAPDATKNVKAYEQMEHWLNNIKMGTAMWGRSMEAIATHGEEISATLEIQEKLYTKNSAEYDKVIANKEKEAHIVSKVAGMWKDLLPKEKHKLRLLIEEMKHLQSEKEDVTVIAKKYDEIVDASKQIAKSHNRKNKAVEAMSSGMVTKSIGFVGALMGAKLLGQAFEELEKGMHQISYESSLFKATLADTVKGHALDNMFEVTSDIQHRLGQSAVTIRQAWITGMKKGTRNAGELRKSLDAGLGLSYAIDSNAEATAEEFHKWNMEVGLTGSKAMVLAMNIKQAAASTGVMGDNMMKAVAKAREIAQSMKNTGFNIKGGDAGATSSRYIANASTIGKDEDVSEIMKALGGGLDGFTKLPREMKTLIIQAGLADDVLSGKAMSSTENIDKSMKAVAGVYEREIMKLPGAIVDKEGKLDISKVSNKDISDLTIQLRRVYGEKSGVGDMVMKANNIKDANTPLTKQIELLEAAINASNGLTEKELKAKNAALDQMKSRQDIEKNAAMLSALGSANDIRSSDIKNKGQTDASTVASIQKAIEQAAKDAEGKGIKIEGNYFDLMSQSLESVNNRLKKAGQAELPKELLDTIREASKTNDLQKMATVLEQIQEGNQLADTKTLAQGSILRSKEQEERNTQAVMQETMGKILRQLQGTPRWAMWIVAVLAAVVSVGKILAMSRWLWKGIKAGTDKMRKRGSAYTHDIRLVALNKKILAALQHKHGMGAGSTGDAKKSLLGRAWDGIKGIGSAIKRKLIDPIINGLASAWNGIKGLFVGASKKSDKAQVVKGAAKTGSTGHGTTIPKAHVSGKDVNLKPKGGAPSHIAKPHLAPKGKGIMSSAASAAGEAGGALGGLTAALGPLAAVAGVAAGAFGVLIGIFTLAMQHSKALQDAVKPIMDAFGKFMGRIGDTLAPFVVKLLPVFESALKELEPIFGFMSDIFSKVTESASPLIKGLIPKLIHYFESMKPVYMSVISIFKDVFEIVMEVVSALTPMIALWNTLIYGVLQAVIAAIKPIVVMFSTMVSGIMKDLFPVLKTLVGIFLGVLGPVLKILVTLFSIYGRVMLKILAPILKLGARLLMLMIKPLIKLMPLLEKFMVPALNALEKVIEVLLVPLEIFADLLDSLGDEAEGNENPIKVMGGLFTYLKDVFVLLTTPVTLLITKLGIMGDTIKTVIDFINRLNPFSSSDNAVQPDGTAAPAKSSGRKLLDLATTSPALTIGKALLGGSTPPAPAAAAGAPAPAPATPAAAAPAPRSTLETAIRYGGSPGLALAADLFGFADGGLINKAGSTVGSAPVPIIAHVGEAILNGEQQNRVAKALNTFMLNDLSPTLATMADMQAAFTTARTGTATASKNIENGTATSASMSDLDEQIERKVQNSKPPSAIAAANDELVKIAVNSDALVRLAQEQTALLEDILNKFDQSVSMRSDTSLETSPKSKTNYHKWPQGRYGDTAAKQYQ